MIGLGPVCLALAGPELEAGTTVREAVSYWSKPGHVGPTVAKVTVSFLGCP